MSTDTAILGGHEHYLTSDGIRTFVGPVRHRASRRLARARQQISDKIRKYKENTLNRFTPDDTPTHVLPVMQEASPEETTITLPKIVSPFNEVTKVLEGLRLPTFTVQPDQPEQPEGYRGARRGSAWKRLKESVTDRLYDSAWHEMVRNTACTAGYVALIATSVIIFGKAVVWMVML